MSAPLMLTAQQVSPRLVCPHCGAWAWYSFPVPVAVFTAAMRAFLVAHRPCADAARRHLPPREEAPP
jgi:hypothetical protein